MKSLFLNKSKKYTAGFFGFIFIFSLFFGPPKEAVATLPVIDYAAQAQLSNLGYQTTLIDASTVATAASGATTAGATTAGALFDRAVKFVSDKWYQVNDAITQHAGWTKEYILDPLAWTMANVLIDKFGDAIVDWIRNGFNGSPMFLSDSEGFFRDVANDASGAIINEFNMQWLCNPLSKLHINLDFFFPGTNRSKYNCTFNDIANNFRNIAGRRDISDWIDVNINVHQKNIVTEFGNDYRNGGFLMWLMTTQKKNNDLGRTLQMANDAYAAARLNVGTEKFNLDLNAGFFGVRKCVEWREATDLEGNPKKGDCIKKIDTTPGQLVQDQMKSVGGKDLSRLMVADEIDEIIGALATTMIGWVLTGGNDGGGVLGYDKNAGYSGSNRDHFGQLDKNQQLIKAKTDLDGQGATIKGNERLYMNTLGDHIDGLYNIKSKLETTLAKLRCVKAANTIANEDNSACDGMNANVKNVNLSALDKTENNVTADIGKTENKLIAINAAIADFSAKHGSNATTTSSRALKLFEELDRKVMEAFQLSEINDLTEQYCYEYDATDESGKICGLFGNKSGNNAMAVYVASEKNPIAPDIDGKLKTRIYWKATNAESCETRDGEKIWRGTEINTSGSYITTDFQDNESRIYSVRCRDSQNNKGTMSVSIAANNAAANLSGSLFADAAIVSASSTAKLYWLTTNAEKCRLYSDKDAFDGKGTLLNNSTEKWYKGPGNYLSVDTVNTKGQITARVEANGVNKYKLICAGSDGSYSALAEINIGSIEGERETYQTRSQTEFKKLAQEMTKTATETNDIEREFACLLNSYTHNEGVSNAECRVFERGSSSSSSLSP